MKKLLFLILCTTTLGLVSCKKDNIINETTPNRTFVYTIKPADWELNSNGYNYTATLDIKEIDNITLDDEGVLVYLSHPINSSSYIQVPFTYDVKAYSYELYNGGIKIDIQSSDDQKTDPVKPTTTMTAKIVVIPSNFQP
jgi:hypothetical protein